MNIKSKWKLVTVLNFIQITNAGKLFGNKKQISMHFKIYKPMKVIKISIL